MATSDALWIQGTDVEPENRPQYTGKLLRQLITAIYTEGVLDGGVVSEDSGGASMDVDVSALVATVDGDDESGQGTYMVFKDATTVTIGAAPGSNSRYDIVIAQVNDEQAGGAEGDNVEITSIAGTASSSPVAPDVPDSAILLATIGPITSSTTSITDDLISDSRSMATLRHDVVDDAGASRIGTESAVAGAIVRRNASGRASIADPVADGNIATKGYVDAVGTSTATGSTIMRRAPSGTTAVADPTDPTHAATKGYVDGTTTPTGGTLASGQIQYGRLGPSSGGLVTVVADGWTGGVASLPAGYRPADGMNFPAFYFDGFGGNGVGYVTILANGSILGGQSASSTSFSVSFFAA